jgi:hypothetical protein
MACTEALGRAYSPLILSCRAVPGALPQARFSAGRWPATAPPIAARNSLQPSELACEDAVGDGGGDAGGADVVDAEDVGPG